MTGDVVERDPEARALNDFLERMESGPAGLLVLGEAGIGKTTLISNAADHAAALGFRVLSANGSPTEVTYAYSAMADLLSAVDDPTLADLPGRQRSALSHARSGIGNPTGTDIEERVVATAFLAVIEHLSARAPVLLAVDDIQWVDTTSKSAIGFAARRFTGRIGLLMGMRTNDSSSNDEFWLQLRRPDALTRLRMRPLSLGGTHALIAKRLGRTLPRPAITRIHEISGGNPLFALELAANTPAEVSEAALELPDSLAALVRRRIGHADETAQTVLLAAACAAAPTVELLAAAMDMSAAQVVEALEPLEDLGIIELGATRVNFTHPLYSTGVYTSASPARRRAMHRTLAAIVGQAELSARHLALAATSPDPETVAALDAAAALTRSQGAPAAAAELLEMAISLGGDEPGRRMRAAEQHFRSGNALRAETVLDDATFGQLEGITRIAALILRAVMRIHASSHLEAADLLGQAAEEAAGVPVMLAPILLFRSHAQLNSGQHRSALDSAEHAVTIAEQVQSASLISQALAARTNAGFHCGRGVDEPSLRRSLELQHPDSDIAIPLGADAIGAMVLAWSGELEEAHLLMQRVRARCEERGADTEMLWVELHSAMIGIWRGNLAEASHAAEEAVQRAQQLGGEAVMAIAFTLRAAIAAYVGKEDDARADAAVALRLASKRGAAFEIQRPIETVAFLEVSAGRYEEALAVMQPRLNEWDQMPSTEVPTAAFMPYAVEALTALGRADEAEPMIAMLEANGKRLDRPWMLAIAARGRAHLYVAQGDLQAAEHASKLAMVHHERLPMPFERACTQLLLGQLQRRRRRRQAAEKSLSEALETFERVGTRMWASRARAELDRLHNSRGDGARLTDVEQRISALAAVGLSNKQIATQLFISDKTVEMNLSRVYRKLGIRSRAGLAMALEANAGDVADA